MLPERSQVCDRLPLSERLPDAGDPVQEPAALQAQPVDPEQRHLRRIREGVRVALAKVHAASASHFSPAFSASLIAPSSASKAESSG